MVQWLQRATNTDIIQVQGQQKQSMRRDVVSEHADVIYCPTFITPLR